MDTIRYELRLILAKTESYSYKLEYLIFQQDYKLK